MDLHTPTQLPDAPPPEPAPHRLLSEALVLEAEDKPAFERLVAGLYVQLQPANPIARILVDNMAAARWRQLRTWTLETDILDLEARKHGLVAPAFRDLADHSKALRLLDRCEIRYDRQFNRSLRLFLQLNQPDYKNFQTNPIPNPNTAPDSAPPPQTPTEPPGSQPKARGEAATSPATVQPKPAPCVEARRRPPLREASAEYAPRPWPAPALTQPNASGEAATSLAKAQPEPAPCAEARTRPPLHEAPAEYAPRPVRASSCYTNSHPFSRPRSFMHRPVSALILGLFAAAALVAQDDPTPPAQGGGRGGAGGGGAALAAPNPQPYERVITKDAKSKKGVFTVHQIGERYYYEIPKNQLDKHFLWNPQISKTTAGAGYGGQQITDRVVAWNLRANRVYLQDINFTRGRPEVAHRQGRQRRQQRHHHHGLQCRRL